MTFLRRIAYSGTQFAQTPSERRSILLSNIISFVVFALGMLLMIGYFFWYGWDVVMMCIPIVSTLCLLTVLLNSFNLSTLSRLWLSLLVPAATLAISIYSKIIFIRSLDELDYFAYRLIMLVGCTFPALFFSFKEKRIMLGASFMGFMLLMLYDPLHNFFGVPYIKNTLKETNYYFTNVVTFVAYICMVGAVMMLKKISEHHETRAEKLIQDLNHINEELTAKNWKIEMQNQEILAQSENLSASQKMLKEAYEIIEGQKDLLLQQNENLSSELVQANNDLTATNNELIKHNNELRQFSYTVSHNLRGPVASLSGLINLMDQLGTVQEKSQIFEHIKTSIHRLETIIQDLTKIIDIRDDIFQIRQKIDLKSEISHVVQSVQKEITAHFIDIEIDVANCREIYSIKPMVHSILYNLISNAIKYRAPERKPKIEITSRKDDRFYIVEIKDNGLGIDLKNHYENMFKLYKRFHHHTEGKGLGLYLVKLQAETLGGSVQVESEINRFTKFVVRLKQPANVEKQILFQNSFVQIFYDARLNSSGIVWSGPITSDQYRSAFLKCLEFIKAYNTPNYIADLRRQGTIRTEDQLWMFHTMMPDAANHGLKRIAGIVSDRKDPKLNEYYSGIQENLTKLGIHQEFFPTPEQAMDWIQQENEKASLAL